MSRRVPDGDEQGLQQFINQSPWDAGPVQPAYRARLAAELAEPGGVIVIDDTGFAKQGKHSVGVARQYSGTLGKVGNCQIAVSLHYATRVADYPLALRLYLPEAWTEAPERLEAAHVPAAERTFQTKWEIALDLLDTVRAEGLPVGRNVAATWASPAAELPSHRPVRATTAKDRSGWAGSCSAAPAGPALPRSG